jgi:hypothetical protein
MDGTGIYKWHGQQNGHDPFEAIPPGFDLGYNPAQVRKCETFQRTGNKIGFEPLMGKTVF